MRRLFPAVAGSVSACIVLVQHVPVFLLHTAPPTHRQCRIARSKKRLAPRLARSIRSQPVINTGHYRRFNPHVTRSPPIGIVKLSEVFMNNG